MDFNTIETPSQLVEQNNQPEFNENEQRCVDIVEALIAEGPKVGLATVKILLEKLEDMHQAGVDDRTEEGNMEGALMWQKDLIKLQTVNHLLEDVVV